MNEIQLTTDQSIKTQFTNYVSPIMHVDGAESIVIQTHLDATPVATVAKYKIQGSLDGTAWATLRDANNLQIEISLDERYRIATIRNSNAKMIRITGSGNSSQDTIKLVKIHVRYK